MEYLDIDPDLKASPSLDNIKFEAREGIKKWIVST